MTEYRWQFSATEDWTPSDIAAKCMFASEPGATPREVFRIGADGSVVVNDEASLDEASKAFWAAVRASGGLQP